MIRFMDEVLFWGHMGLVVFGLFAGYFLSLPAVVLGHALHRLHIWWFEECILSKWQRKLGFLPSDLTFQQYAAKRLFGKDISRQQNNKVGFGLVFISIVVAAVV